MAFLGIPSMNKRGRSNPAPCRLWRVRGRRSSKRDGTVVTPYDQVMGFIGELTSFLWDSGTHQLNEFLGMITPGAGFRPHASFLTLGLYVLP